MLTFEQKKAIFWSFSDLEESQISNERINFVYLKSKHRGKVLARELTLSGNGYIRGLYMDKGVIDEKGYKIDPRGWINIKFFTKDELIELINLAIKSMS